MPYPTDSISIDTSYLNYLIPHDIYIMCTFASEDVHVGVQIYHYRFSNFICLFMYGHDKFAINKYSDLYIALGMQYFIYRPDIQVVRLAQIIFACLGAGN